jgi:hypothetical protein
VCKGAFKKSEVNIAEYVILREGTTTKLLLIFLRTFENMESIEADLVKVKKPRVKKEKKVEESKPECS